MTGSCGLTIYINGAQFLVTDFAEAEPGSSGALSLELDFSEEVPWQAFSEARVDELAGRPVFIDFTADGCLSCKANEKTVLASQTVRDAMKESGVVPVGAVQAGYRMAGSGDNPVNLDVSYRYLYFLSGQNGLSDLAANSVFINLSIPF